MKTMEGKAAKYRNWTVSQLRQEATTLAQENDLLRAKLEQAQRERDCFKDMLAPTDALADQRP